MKFLGSVSDVNIDIYAKFIKLSYLEVTFLETSYLSVFELYRPIIYRPDWQEVVLRVSEMKKSDVCP